MAEKPQNQSFWKQNASRLTGEPNPEWIELLQQNLQSSHPQKLAELAAADDLQAYLKVMVASAESQLQLMMDSGMGEPEATELALKDLLQPSSDDADRTTDWEAEGADADMVAALSQYLGR